MLEHLYVLAGDLLQAGAEVLAEAGLDVPTRRAVDVGTALAPLGFSGECEPQLNVVVAGPASATLPQLGTAARSARGACVLVWSATFTLTLWRCHDPAGPVLPTPAEIDAAARSHLADGWQLARALGWRWAAGTLLPSYAAQEPCAAITPGPFVTIGPTGGLRGWASPWSVLLDGTYDPATGL